MILQDHYIKEVYQIFFLWEHLSIHINLRVTILKIKNKDKEVRRVKRNKEAIKRFFCFISISQFRSFKNTLSKLTNLCTLGFRHRKFIVCTNEISEFCEQWQQHMQLKSMEINEAWSDEEYTHQFQPGPSHKIWMQQNKHAV